ncbi:hypothetical protein [Rhodoflexus caldus]|uniref:hypothetical protein n=1 Tax=Rhodoflexus caldus TaxID=2891236 RepID=UPI00202A6234|nr:hypothetical protein [Rhodoflexus caldus]
MKKIITTVGTSIFSNFFKDGKNATFKNDYDTLDKANHSFDKWNDNQVIECIEGTKGLSQKNGLRKNVFNNIKSDDNASAEIKSILKITEEAQVDTEVYLMATDTVLSVLACELIKEWFENYKSVTQKITVHFAHNDTHIIKDLRVDSKGNYEKGFMNLIEQLDKLKLSKNDILNITGGYKAIIPILTLYGQLKEIPLKYIYNETELDKTNELVTVGNLPINFDLGYIENYVNFIINPNLLSVNHQAIVNQMFKLGLLKSENIPAELSVIGELIKNKLNSDDLPFEKTTMGYFVEYKLYEYFVANKPHGYTNVILGFKLSDEPDRDLEDADLWFSNEGNNNVIAVEIKPSSISAKAMRSKIRKNIGLINQLNPQVSLQEFWIILYEFQSNPFQNELNWCQSVLNQEVITEFPNIVFKIKKMTINQNVIDGNRNRLRYQEFMRSTIGNVCEIFSTQQNQNPVNPEILS